MTIAEVGRRSHDHIGTSQDKQVREDKFILNARGQPDSVSDVGGVANRWTRRDLIKLHLTSIFSEISRHQRTRALPLVSFTSLGVLFLTGGSIAGRTQAVPFQSHPRRCRTSERHSSVSRFTIRLQFARQNDEVDGKIRAAPEPHRGCTEPVTSGNILAGSAKGEKTASTTAQADSRASRDLRSRVQSFTPSGYQSHGPQYFT